MTTWRERLHSIWAWIKGPRGKRGVYRDLRSMALRVDPATIRMPEGERWSGALVAAMEIGMPEATTTVVAIADGTVSMYLSSGGGVIGAGEHAAVRGAADVFRTVVAENRNLLVRTGSSSHRRPGRCGSMHGSVMTGSPGAQLRRYYGPADTSSHRCTRPARTC